ncbi:MAG: hypothetical protein K2X66_02630, partial [Cyanobacteria bacterium]|nr:hypothetical protein [Cyanobacteriota bacterium]
SPLCRGLITERFIEEYGKMSFPENDFRSSLDKVYLDWVHQSLMQVKSKLAPDGNIADAALQYVLQSEDVSVVIPGMKRLNHLHSAVEQLDRFTQDSTIASRYDSLIPPYYPGFE